MRFKISCQKLIKEEKLKYIYIILIALSLSLSGCWGSDVGRSYYPSGKIKTSALVRNGLLSGQATMFYESGSKMSEATYKSGVLHGDSVSYFENEKIKATSSYHNGVLNGTSSEWDKEGHLIHEVIFVLGVVKK